MLTIIQWILSTIYYQIADSINAFFMVDMAHIAGMVAANVMPSPFDYADVVTTTTHKSLRGPRGAMIFYRKGERGKDKNGKSIVYELENAINASVFPGHQGGPHNHTIAALAVALNQVISSCYRIFFLKKVFFFSSNKCSFSFSFPGKNQLV